MKLTLLRRASFALAALLSIPVLAAPPEKPNIIFILADDMGYADIGPFGSVKNHTPNLDRMAKEGMKFTSFYAAPVCTPSRAQILTGCYAKRVSLPDVIFPKSHVGLATNEHTIASVLKESGYATFAIGKWHVGDDRQFLPTHHGFDHYIGLPYSNDMGGEEPGKNRDPWKKRTPPLPLVRDETVIETLRPQDQDKLTALYTSEAVKFIHDNKDHPFFLYLPHTAVHIPLHPGQAFRGKSGNGLYGDWVEEIDWCVGQVMEEVRAEGLGEKTLIVFSSDNGPWLAKGTNAGTAGPLRGGKGGTFEGGMREPTLFWWPGQIAAGSVSDAVAGNIDLLPTFAKLGGAPVPADHKIDGRDMSGLFLGTTTQSPHEALYYFASTSLQAVRSGPWKLALVPQYDGHGAYKSTPPDLSKTADFRLYNLDEDIGEKNNVIAGHPDVVQRLLVYVREMDADLGIGRKNGPGVRQPGRVEQPVGLWKAGEEPPAGPEVYKPTDALRIGDELDAEAAPQIGQKSIQISARVKPAQPDGIIVAQGGSRNGYTLYLTNNVLTFGMRVAARFEVAAAPVEAGREFSVEAKLNGDGSMTLSVDGQVVAKAKVPGPINKQPEEPFCVGFDNGAPVGKYHGKATDHFQGTIEDLKIVTADVK